MVQGPATQLLERQVEALDSREDERLKLSIIAKSKFNELSTKPYIKTSLAADKK